MTVRVLRAKALIAPGAYTDVLLVDGDPLTDIGVLTGRGERLDLIAGGGEIVANRRV